MNLERRAVSIRHQISPKLSQQWPPQPVNFKKRGKTISLSNKRRPLPLLSRQPSQPRKKAVRERSSRFWQCYFFYLFLVPVVPQVCGIT
jgi:hypothetical protein